eukprot:sb/3468490/
MLLHKSYINMAIPDRIAFEINAKTSRKLPKRLFYGREPKPCDSGYGGVVEHVQELTGFCIFAPYIAWAFAYQNASAIAIMSVDRIAILAVYLQAKHMLTPQYYPIINVVLVTIIYPVQSDPDLPGPDLPEPRFTGRKTFSRFKKLTVYHPDIPGTPIYRAKPFTPSIPVNRGPTVSDLCSAIVGVTFRGPGMIYPKLFYGREPKPCSSGFGGVVEHVQELTGFCIFAPYIAWAFAYQNASAIAIMSVDRMLAISLPFW